MLQSTHLLTSPNVRRLLVVCGIGITVLCCWIAVNPSSEQPKRRLPVSAPPPVPDSRFLNTAADAQFAGRAACVTCHAEADRTYQQTAHSRALAPVDPEHEPHDAEFHASSSGLWYRSFRKDDELWHQESFRSSDGTEHVLAEYPLQWSIGSGRFSKSYLANVDGFLIQSPVTWYAARPGWDLSPGYEQYNSGFERTAELRCVLCHVGRAEPIEGSYHRIRIHTQAIDCERCHGPGSMHVALRSSGAPVAEPDLTIVHPERLGRERSEAICAQCHLHGAAMVDIRGRSLSDFRPGLKLHDVSVPYGLESPGQEMQVVGHMEQMRLSRCYQETETMTCTTCHDPHQQPKPIERLSFYRRTCLSCHDVQSCGLPEASRLQTDSQDNCVACHMPESPTEIPHFAFTHHRIGIHGTAAQEESTQAQKLVPLADVSHLSQIDQDRGLGLAYVQVSDLPEHFRHADVYRAEARRILDDVRRRGLKDPAVDAALARLYWRINEKRTSELAADVLAEETANPEDRATALFTLATTHFQRGNVAQAVPLLEELVQLRRYADAWHALSLCHEELGDVPASIAASAQAARISPIRPDFQQRLAYLYEESHRPELARHHRQRFRLLKELLGRP